jgi:hypothetical protein
LVNWKTDLKLSDLEAGALIEITCRRCGQIRTDTAATLICRPEFDQAYLDEVERALRCASRFCLGPVRIALIQDGKSEGFVGGMA